MNQSAVHNEARAVACGACKDRGGCKGGLVTTATEHQEATKMTKKKSLMLELQNKSFKMGHSM